MFIKCLQKKTYQLTKCIYDGYILIGLLSKGVDLPKPKEPMWDKNLKTKAALVYQNTEVSFEKFERPFEP